MVFAGGAGGGAAPVHVGLARLGDGVLELQRCFERRCGGGDSIACRDAMGVLCDMRLDPSAAAWGAASLAARLGGDGAELTFGEIVPTFLRCAGLLGAGRGNGEADTWAEGPGGRWGAMDPADAAAVRRAAAGRGAEGGDGAPGLSEAAAAAAVEAAAAETGAAPALMGAGEALALLRGGRASAGGR